MSESSRASSQQRDIYIPADRRLALASGTALPERTQGAALFADISGFTVLTENMQRAYGPRDGAERLAQDLNRVYGALIAEVDRYGGSVIGFSGDAVTCWFDNVFVHPLAEQMEEQPYGSAPLRAVASGLAMLAAMRRFSAIDVPGQGRFTLSIKIAVASGPVRRFLVGDPDCQYIDAAAGETMLRMATAERLAQRDQIVVDAATVAAIGPALQVGDRLISAENGEQFALVCGLSVSPHPAPWPEVGANPLADEQARPWLLPAVYDRLHRGRGEYLTELRPATALFARFDGLNFEHDPEAGEKLDRYIRWVQQVVRRYDGTLIQLTIGEKGSYYYVAFGAPRAHEDDPWRAASAALEMIHPPEALSFISQVQIGISKGMMRTGAYGGQTRRTYGVLGDEVNLAARLMQNAAAGQILVSEAVQSALETACIWELLPPIRVKGKIEPVHVAALTGLADARDEPAEYQGILVGREAELEALLQNVGPICAEPGEFAGIIAVDGEAGIGKSRLIHTLRRRVCEQQMESAQATNGVAWFECPADPILQQSLYPIRHFLRGYFNQNPERSPAENRQDFDSVLDGLLEHLSAAEGDLKVQLERTRSFLGTLVDLHWPGSLYEQLEPKLRFENTLAAVRDLLLAESMRRPVVLHIEDAHRLDPDTLALLEVIIRKARPYRLAILLSGRFCDETGTDCLPNWGDPPVKPKTILLRELSGQQAADLAAQVLASLATASEKTGLAAPLDQQMAQYVIDKTNGNPLFIEELCKELFDRGLAVAKNGAWTLAGDQGEEAPASLTALLVSRLDRLDVTVKEAVQTAAVIGREFEAPVLVNMLALDEMSVNSMEQARAEMIWLPAGVNRYIFRQSLLRDAAYNMQPQSRLQIIHAQAANMIESIYAGDLAPHFADLAYHFDQGRDDARAFFYARLAGGLAASQYANPQAIHFYQMALRCAEHLPPHSSALERLAVHAALGELLVTTGQHQPAAEHLNLAIDLAAQQGEADAQARACRWLARLHENRGEYPEALASIQRGLEALGERETAETSELLNNAGLIYSRRGDYANALVYAERCQKIARNIANPAAQARADNLLGHIDRLRGENAAAIEHFENSLKLYEQARDINGQALASNQLANSLFGLGRWRDAGQRFSQARTFFEQIGDLYHRAFTDNNLGWIALNQGRLQDALDYYQQGLAALEQTGGSPYVMGAYHNNLGATYIRMGNAADAARYLEISQSYFEKAGARDWLPELHRHKASAALLAGNLTEAQAQGKQALTLAREFKMRAEEGNSLRVLGEIAAAKDDCEAARQSFRSSLEVLAEVGDEYEHARSLLALARLNVDNRQEIQSELKKAIPVLERLGAKQDLTEARRMLFRTLKETSR